LTFDLKSIAIFVVDVDGTLCDYEGVLSMEAAHSLQWLRKLGYEVVLASGRGVWDTYYLAHFLGLTKIVICENGGVVASSPLDITLLSDNSESLRAYELLSKRIENVKTKIVSPRFTEVVLLRNFDLEEGNKVLREEGVGAYINDSKFAYHIDRLGVDKATGLSYALKVLNLSAEQVVVIGDSKTDVPLFKQSGYSIALGNADEDVRKAASWSSRATVGEGVVEAVEHVASKFFKRTRRN
jgi:phosphoglycolate phosphatase (TIGR01487 family)